MIYATRVANATGVVYVVGMTNRTATYTRTNPAEYRRLTDLGTAAYDRGDYAEASRLYDAALAADGYTPPTAAEEHAENARIARAEAR